ncbi:MDR family MFS transporter [Pseudonocardia phyllosphaerae]|uniref:MDR family MFS transporter n=1 Tax=Pseudonocardia phyllosphaerae TaxID=3390502 RepID=UPI00397CA240
MAQHSATPVSSSAPAALDRRLILLAVTTLIGGFASMLDATIVSVAVPALSHSLYAPLSTLQWVVTGYLLAMMAVIPVTGWAVERYGARRVWLFALVIFLGGSVLSGAAWSVGSLIGFRLLQGVGGGMILPVAQTIVVQAAGPERIGRIMSLIAVPAQLAPICGPVIGGLLVDGLSWRWMFYVNVPICLAAIVMSLVLIPAGGPAPHHKLDLLGLMLLSPGLAALVYGLSLSADHGFTHPLVISWLAAGLALLCGYAVHALRPKVTAIIDLRLFRSRAFSTASTVMFLYGVSIFAAMFLLPLYYVQARGASALYAGLLLAPQGLGTLLALTIVGKFTDRVGPRPIILIGLAIATVGTLPFVFFAHDGNMILLGAALLVRGMGLGAAIVPANAAAYQGLPDRSVPRATSAVNIVQRIGQAFGTAVLALVLESQLVAHNSTATGMASAFSNTFLWTLILTGAALVPALLIPGHRATNRTPA